MFSRKTSQHRRFARRTHLNIGDLFGDLRIGDLFEENISKSAIVSRKTPQNRRCVRGKRLTIDDWFEENISKSAILSREIPIPRRGLLGAPWARAPMGHKLRGFGAESGGPGYVPRARPPRTPQFNVVDGAAPNVPISGSQKMSEFPVLQKPENKISTLKWGAGGVTCYYFLNRAQPGTCRKTHRN